MKRAWLMIVMVAACGREQAAAPDAAPPPPEPITAPGPPTEVRLDDARALLRKGEVGRARGLLERLVLEAPTDAPIWTALAAARLAGGDHMGAIEAARRATTLDPRNAEAYVTGGAALRAHGDLEGAVKALERALSLDATLASAHWNLAGIHGLSGELDKEALTLDALLKEHPDDIQARFARAQNALRQKDARLAKQLALELVERAPTHQPAQRMLAALAWDERDYRQAFERAKIALRLDESDNAADKLLAASFYVLVGAELWCQVGPRPWDGKQVLPVIEAFMKRTDLEGGGIFADIDEQFGGEPDVRARIEAFKALQCPPSPK